MFYYDKKMKELENQKRYKSIIESLEIQFKNSFSDELLATIIGYSWYLFIEGPCLNRTEIDNIDFYFTKWKEYSEISLRGRDSFSKLITAFTFLLHGFNIDNNYEELGRKILIKITKTSNSNQQLAIIFLNETIKAGDNEMAIFESESIIDDYFRYIISV